MKQTTYFTNKKEMVMGSWHGRGAINVSRWRAEGWARGGQSRGLPCALMAWARMGTPAVAANSRQDTDGWKKMT